MLKYVNYFRKIAIKKITQLMNNLFLQLSQIGNNRWDNQQYNYST